MADPNTVVCRNCFRCIQECPRGALEKSLEKVFTSTGGAYWKPDMLLTLYKQAEDGDCPRFRRRLPRPVYRHRL